MKTFIQAMVLPIALFFVVGCADKTEPKTTFTLQAPTATDEQKPVFKDAAKILFNTCTGLKKYLSDIDSVEAVIREVHLEVDWVTGIDYKIKISDNPKNIPHEWYATGHNLFYLVVGGDRPGINVGKPTAGWFCNGVRGTPFIDEPAASIVDRII